MSRPARIDFPGARHHVMNRGARHAPIFVDDISCTLFLAALADLPTRFGVHVHAYALMPNHFHLLVETPRGNLSAAMKHLAGEYVRALNAHHKWDGPLFRGRFRNRVVETDEYWRNLLLYLHLNPVRAGLVTRVEDSVWTSHEAYAGTAKPPAWLTTSDLLGAFGGHATYLDEIDGLRTGRIAFPSGFEPEAMWEGTSTTESEVMRVLEARDVSGALARVAKACGVGVDVLVSGRRGRVENRPRWVAAWWLVNGLGLSNRAAARAIGANEAQVSRWLPRVAADAAEPGDVKGWVEALQAE